MTQPTLLNPNKVVYPGTFDPITRGHMDIIKRILGMYQSLVVAVAANHPKQPLFSLEERVDLVRSTLEEEGISQHVDVLPMESLLVDFTRSIEAKVIIRGLRALSDFEYEFQMAGMNAVLAPDIETIFMMSSEKNQFISSRFVKDVAHLGGDVSSFVAPLVFQKLQHLNKSK
ncbi:MAG: pantetheine-phosphate adenylyltransferase [Caedimonadaceae bacterium]|nr:MAG: pantetheine-phosphate adenylyltransferase [Caedimonadaceae bacterium]